jgi:hypothetical protein
LGKPEREDKFGSSHQELGRQSFKKSRKPFVTHHLRDDLEAALGVIEVPVLNPSFDDIEGGGDNKGSAGTCYGCNEIL